MNKQLILNLVLIAIIIALLTLRKCESDNFKQEIGLINAANDTLVKVTNKDGSKTATIELMQADNVEMFLELRSKDSVIKHLQNEVKKNKSKLRNGGSVTTLNTETTFSSTTATSVYTNSSDSCNPIYTTNSTDSTWIKYNIRASKDSTVFKLRVKDNYSVVIGRQKIGFLKYKSIVDVTSMNPYTNIRSLRAFKVEDRTPDRRINLSIQAGYGVTLKGLGPYLGIGLGFRLL